MELGPGTSVSKPSRRRLVSLRLNLNKSLIPCHNEFKRYLSAAMAFSMLFFTIILFTLLTKPEIFI